MIASEPAEALAIPASALTPPQTPFVPVPYPNFNDLTITKSSDKGSPSLLSHGNQDDYVVWTMKNVSISN